MDIIKKKELYDHYINDLNNFFNKYYNNSFNCIDIRINYDKDLIYINSFYVDILDIIYNILKDITIIYEYKCCLFLHCLKIKPFSTLDIKKDIDFTSKLIHKINREFIEFSYQNFINYNNKKFFKNKDRVNELKYLSIPYDIINHIGNYIEPNFSKYNYLLENFKKDMSFTDTLKYRNIFINNFIYNLN
jgi:hypothetical protein